MELLLLLLAGSGVLFWSVRARRLKRRETALKAPVDEETRRWVSGAVPHFAGMPQPLQERLFHLTRAICMEKTFEGCAGFALNDEVKTVISAQAALLVLELGLEAYDGIDRILVYPEPFVVDRAHEEGGIVAHEEEAVLSGEAGEFGTIVLSWSDVVFGARHESDGYNVVIHEFAHQLDWATGEITGTPKLESAEDYAQWGAVMKAAYRKLSMECEGQDDHPVLDPYAVEDPGEFFAIASEVFFEKPVVLREWDAPLYALLKHYYRLDPAGWVRG